MLAREQPDGGSAQACARGRWQRGRPGVKQAASLLSYCPFARPALHLQKPAPETAPRWTAAWAVAEPCVSCPPRPPQAAGPDGRVLSAPEACAASGPLSPAPALPAADTAHSTALEDPPPRLGSEGAPDSPAEPGRQGDGGGGESQRATGEPDVPALTSNGASSRAGPASQLACGRRPVPAVPCVTRGLSFSLPGSPAAERPEAAGNPAVLFWECAAAPGHWAAAEMLAPPVSTPLFSPLMTRRSPAVMLSFRATDGVVEGLNSSCGFAKVGPGHKQPILQASDATAWVLAVTHAVTPL